VILLAEHDEPSLAAKKKRQHVALETATSTPKNRVWNFFGSPPGRISCEPGSTPETATGSVQFSYETASGQAYYYTFDHLGSTREMLNSSGTIVARYDYDPFGKTTLVSGSDMATFQYAGMMKHQPSGLYLTPVDEDGDGGRIYDSATARFINRDFDGAELLPEGPNLYSYVGNNPINYIDPNGSDAAAATAALGEGGGVLGEEEAGGWAAGGNFDPYVDAALAATALGVGGYATYEYFQPPSPKPDPAPITPTPPAPSPAQPITIPNNIAPTIPTTCNMAEHTKGKRPSTKGKHEKGKRDKGRKNWDKKRQHPGWQSKK
jgi:RHS repeat-associated protein